MPSLHNCRNCIIANDVQAHTIHKNILSAKWQDECNADERIRQVIESFRQIDGSYSLSRRDVFLCEDSFEKVTKALWWGYPNGMRVHFHEVVQYFGEMANILQPYRNQTIDEHTFDDLYNLLNLQYVGPATISKLLYFFNIYQGNTQCVIVDQFVRESMNYYDEFHPVHENQPSHWYLAHARQINEVNITGATPEQVEFFLFSFRVNH